MAGFRKLLSFVRRRTETSGRPALERADGEASVRRADHLRDAKQYAAAAEAYRDALTYFPSRNDLRVQLGNMLKDCARYDAAEFAYREALASVPEDGDILLQLGRALKLAGRTKDAITAFQAALKAAPHLHDAADELGRLLPLSERIGSNSLRSSIRVLERPTISGWAFDAANVSTPVKLVINLDGVLYQQISADIDRNDLKKIAPDIVGGGFEFVLPSGLGSVSVEVLCQGEHLKGSPFDIELVPSNVIDRIHEARRDGNCSQRPMVTIVVPVHNAAAETAKCLEALVRHTTWPAKLMVIDDASDDPVIRPLLETYAELPAVTIVRNESNLGYTRTANRGIALAGNCDVVLLNSDTEVGPRWLEGLITAAHSSTDIASVTAVSDNAGAFTVPDSDTELPTGTPLATYQRLVTQASGVYWPEVPTGNGFCLYMTRRAIDDVGTFDELAFPSGYGEENDWCMRANRRGWRHLVDDRTLVRHKRSASFGERRSALVAAGREIIDDRYPEYSSLISLFQSMPGLNAARHRVRSILRDLNNKMNVLPRVLYVISTETGGMPQTNRDLMNAVSDRFEAWLLVCNSRQLTLSRPGRGVDGTDEVVARASLPEPLTLVSHRSESYNQQVARWLVEHAIELVHIRHLAWHGLDLPAVAHQLGIPVIFSFHDFYTVCPTIKLLDDTRTYCGGRCGAVASPPADCTPELWHPVVMPPLKGRWVHEWRRKFAGVFEFCNAFVTTSQSAKDTIVDAYPQLASTRFEVIPHGRNFADLVQPKPPAAAVTPLNILVPGNISPAKGRDIIEALARMDRGRKLRFHLLGDVHPSMTGEGIVQHGTYRREDFQRLAKATGAHIGAVFSIWNETYCHTLTEMWASGLPVVAFDFGTVAERIRESEGGWIVPHHDHLLLYENICAIADNVADIADKCRKVSAWQTGEGRLNDCSQMAGRYLVLYDKVLDSRRTLVDVPTCQRLTN